MRWDWTPHTRAKLATFLEARGLTRGDVTTQPIGDGHSNLTFLVSDGTRRVVVRRPPPPPTPPGAHDVLREAHVVGALVDLHAVDWQVRGTRRPRAPGGLQ